MIKKIMKRLADKTVDELKKIREDYVKKYIGDFDKPFGYKSELKTLDRLIAAKESVKEQTNNLQERNQMLEAKILDWYVKSKDEKFAEHFGIKEARNGRV